MDCSKKVFSEEYGNYILQWEINPVEFPCAQVVSNRYRIVYEKLPEIGIVPEQDKKLLKIPKIYSFMDLGALEKTGSVTLWKQPYVNLFGNGTLLGICDTGIEYQNEVFRSLSGKSRILNIWDQGQESEKLPQGFLYGREYDNLEINEALEKGEWLGTYDGFGDPSGTKTEQTLYEATAGHGTFLASAAAGGQVKDSVGKLIYSGAAPESELVVVKLRQCKQYLSDYYEAANDLPAVSEDDIMTGISYLVQKAELYRKPMVILLGMGTSLGAHNGSSILCEYLNQIAVKNGIILVVPAGNETIGKHHFYGTVENLALYRNVEIQVGPDILGFTMEVWPQDFAKFEAELISPDGNTTGRIPETIKESGPVAFGPGPARAYISYQEQEGNRVGEKIQIRVHQPESGVWTLRLYQESQKSGYFHIWLPTQSHLTGTVIFLQPDPYVTITEPGNAALVLTIAAYQYQNQSIWPDSGRGFTADNLLKPDLASPGVNITGPAVYMGRFPQPAQTSYRQTVKTGSSIAASLAAGACLQLLEWGIVRKNLPVMNTPIAKGYLEQGADRVGTLTFPNREWGWGTLNAEESLPQT